jgi:hypothetical protein
VIASPLLPVIRLLAAAPLAALAGDAWIAIGIAALAAAWLVARSVRTFSARRTGGCHCASSGTCGTGGPTLDDLKRAAARGAARVNRGTPPFAR